MKISRYRFLFIASLIIHLFSMQQGIAQEKQLTLQDLIPGGKNYHRFTPKNLRQLQWCGDSYLYVKGDSLLMSAPADQTEQVAFTREQLNDVLALADLPTTGSMPTFSVPDPEKRVLAFQYKNHCVHYDLVSKKIARSYTLDAAWSRFEFCAANSYFAFTEENNVFILSPDSRVGQVTNETEHGIVCGTSVHQNEFGIRKGLFWSPQGSALAFYRMDERMVTDYPIVNISKRVAEVEPHTYPMAGMKSHEVSVGVYHVSNEQVVYLKTGAPKEKYLTNIAWSPDEKSLYIAELNRDQNECRLVRYSAITGEKEAELFTEQHERYVEPQVPIRFLPNNPTRFIWESQRDGYNHLYLYDTNGALIKPLTSGNWVVTEVHGFDKKGDDLFFSSTAPHPENPTDTGDPLERYTWRLNLKNSKLTCLNPKRGVHQVMLSPSGDYLIDQVASPTIPRDIDVVRVKDQRLMKSLLSAPDPYKKYQMPDVKVGTLLAGDGKTVLNYRLTTPPNLDPTQKYPVIVYVYGGPHSQMVTGGWMHGVGGWDLYMAQHGYILFTVDGRGTNNRGFEFESVIHRRLGEKEMEDQLQGVDFLKSLPYVDSNRMGVFGWSYGGFMTTNLMLTHPETFKAGVAGGPVIDWSRYEIMYGERYMDHPKDNPDGYQLTKLCEKAGQLKGHLLLIHGDSDPVVVWQHSLSFLKACVDAGTFPDYFVYPGHQHNVIGKDRPHLMEKIARYFETHL